MNVSLWRTSAGLHNDAYQHVPQSLLAHFRALDEDHPSLVHDDAAGVRCHRSSSNLEDDWRRVVRYVVIVLNERDLLDFELEGEESASDRAIIGKT